MQLNELEIRQMLLAAAAEELERPQEDLERELEDQGDFAIGSQRAISIIAILEKTLKRRLAGVDELEPEEVTSFGALLRTLCRQLGGSE